MQDFQIYRAVTPNDLAQARDVILSSMETDQGYGYQPEWHWDIVNAQEVYTDNERHAMMVAVSDGQVVGTCALRTGGPKCPPHHPELADRYRDRPAVGHISRLVTVPEARRRGVAGSLVRSCLDHARTISRYRVVYLHTNAKSPGALEFWTKSGAAVVRDDRDGWDQDSRFETVHFEFDLSA
ncbi:GNAT family N-acetyltransferase [Austwickia chelonae]|uniref:GNAT family N-acetyltransferase n=1 Tax=Austwickia chelonae TaxID=100225 RepID=UPI0013C2FB52|nr:GNAT family N-acetyltransferase [Austwickia chelonae]